VVLLLHLINDIGSGVIEKTRDLRKRDGLVIFQYFPHQLRKQALRNEGWGALHA
jgi:hypothetical protein